MRRISRPKRMTARATRSAARRSRLDLLVGIVFVQQCAAAAQAAQVRRPRFDDKHFGSEPALERVALKQTIARRYAALGQSSHVKPWHSDAAPSGRPAARVCRYVSARPPGLRGAETITDFPDAKPTQAPPSHGLLANWRATRRGFRLVRTRPAVNYDDWPPAAP